MLKHCLLAAIAILICGCVQNRPKSKATDTATTEVSSTDTTGEKPVPAEQLILPGQSIGTISINENADSVFRKLGKPDAGDAAMGKSLATWYAKHDTSGYETQIFFAKQMGTADEASQVKQIRITSPWFKTMDYMSTGMHLQTIESKKEFSLKKSAQYTDGGKLYFIYDDADAGMAFEIDNRNVCTGIIIHEPRKDATASYIAFHSNTQLIGK
ncbi:hypothetical protein HDF18_18510 [Mucilaginibacter sp. X5P1]|uniref:hypothetical protein n=1 Tax=Mucilaginibacter sp. X5P1 TaxID=2723088 RepID=UPI001617CB33|nr:hypothetical protein [Mucilaginibacter sp. X5P1]MBB6139636.1 hypothetical protein [Mucilaginibacter sp. X5P1]